MQRYRKSSAEAQARLSGYAEMQHVLCKDIANRAQKRHACLSGYAEMQHILCKDTANCRHLKHLQMGLEKMKKRREFLRALS